MHTLRYFCTNDFEIMISILLPLYNFDVRLLVAGLHAQCIEAGIPFEILCFDDGSEDAIKTVHTELSQWPNVNYRELPENVGRSRIRNLLAAAAQYEYLLFLDGDSGIVSPHYIANYLAHLHLQKVLYGGRVYSKTPPADPKLFLHWKYGIHREQMPMPQRQAAPYHGFMTNNFLIPKEIFQAIGFDERLRQYGHEDTLFGLELQGRGIPIVHLDNPLEHLGLEPAGVFLDKAKKAIENLALLAKEHPELSSRLLEMYRRLHRYKMDRVLAGISPLLLPLLQKILLGGRAPLVLLDFYKLLQLVRCAGNAYSDYSL